MGLKPYIVFPGTTYRIAYNGCGHIQNWLGFWNVQLVDERWLRLPSLMGQRDWIHDADHASSYHSIRWYHPELQILPSWSRQYSWGKIKSEWLKGFSGIFRKQTLLGEETNINLQLNWFIVNKSQKNWKSQNKTCKFECCKMENQI